MGVEKKKFTNKFKIRPIENGYLILTFTTMNNKYGETFIKNDEELTQYVSKYINHHFPKLFNKPQALKFEVTVNETD
jgi:hypothetical protein